MAEGIEIDYKQINGVPHIDREIAQYILAHPDGDFSEVLRQNDSWEVVFHLSDLRAALLAWYNFPTGAEVLEIGAGFGAITGYLCEQSVKVTAFEKSAFRAEMLKKRYAAFHNLTVYTGVLENIIAGKQFDYIILTGSFGTADGFSMDFLRFLMARLGSSGKLLLAVDNRYGIKYLCGEQEPGSQQPFGGLRKSPGCEPSYSRSELESILDRAGFLHRKFYYPLPDYRLPQVIYSDRHLPGREMFERIVPYYRSKNTLLLSEMDLYGDILGNHVFPFFSNSFFVECSEGSCESQADYAVVTADRGKARSLVTCMYGNDRFVKRAMYAVGKKCMEQLHANMRSLVGCGLNVIPYRFTADASMEMPYIHEMTAADYLRSLQYTDKNKVLAIFDQFWSMIVRSSVTVASEKNVFHAKAPQADWGPILETAYLEMIPMNCFYREGSFVFFDQEFSRKNCPAKYPMFRAILYCSGYLSHIVSLEELQYRYGLQGLWDVFLAEEDHFHFVLRQHDVYHQFYKWAWADANQIKENICRLSVPAERESLKKRLPEREYEVYSFDVFDTLITRRTATPKGIFVLMRQYLEETAFADIPVRVRNAFVELRIYYERYAYRKLCHDGIEDINLQEIYDVFANREGLSPEQRDRLLRLEQNTEWENVIGIQENLKKVRQLLTESKKVIFISDMYMDENILYEMLRRVDPVLVKIPLYVSSRYRKRKDTGNLYKLIQRELHVSFFDWLHCGDNIQSDCAIPAQLGLQTVRYSTAALLDFERELLSGHENDVEFQMRIGNLKNERISMKSLASADAKGAVSYGLAEDFPCMILHERIAVYGAGRFGQDLCRRLQKIKGKDVVAWVDMNFKGCQHRGMLAVQPPDVLQRVPFDDVVIAVKDNKVVKKIQEFLLRLGIDEKKIIYW